MPDEGTESRPASRGFRRRLRRLTVVFPALTAGLLLMSIASATNVAGFEIDANNATPNHALYSGNEGGDDWTKGASQNGVFAASTSTPHTAATGCYGSNIDTGDALGPSAFICDGNSDPTFNASEPEQTIVSPSGKTPNDVWPVKPGNVRAKNDFSQAYVHATLIDSPCDPDLVANNVALDLAGHVGDNEGDHFWGFEFNRNPPAGFEDLKANDGGNFLLNFDRAVGDLLVSFTVPGNTNEQAQLELFRVTGFVPSGSSAGDAIFTPAAAQPGCPGSEPQGKTLLRTNNFNQITAPPWNVPVCDPTADNGSNSCRLANGTTPAEDLLAQRDFAEARIDLTAFGITPCFSNVIFSSRSAHPLEGADVQDVGGADFPLCASKSGVKFHDLNADGDQDSGEPGLNGWTINLYRNLDGDTILDANEAVPAQTTTTATVDNVVGSYKFANLQNGDYIVCEVLQAGWNQSAPTPSSGEAADCTSQSGVGTLGAVGHAFTVTGTNHTGNDFGNFKNATKAGTKWEDLDADGVRDQGEPGLAGVQIHLFGTNGAGNPVHLHDTTDANGDYSISVAPGSYTVCETVPAGYTQSFPTSGPSCAGHEDASGFGYSITLTSNQTDAGNDFGNFQNATKSGTKFDDLDADSVRDQGEPGIAGVRIHLFGTNGQGNAVHVHTMTDADGNYSFSVAPGSYTVCETVPAGYTQSFPTSGPSCAGHEDASGFGYSITLASGQTDAGNDFGNFRNATKSGTKFDDLNADGDRDPSEPGIADVRIHLFGTDGQGNAVHVHAVTDANGNYSFSVAPGSYTVCETVPAGYTQSFPTSGPDCTGHEDASGFGYSITLISGQVDAGNDFGNFRNATKSGTKFDDLDADSVRDPNEPGIAGVRIHLFGTNGAGNSVHLHATTDADGNYSFSVAPGSYTVCETVPAGYIQSFPTSGPDCAGHEDASGFGYSITLTSGQVDAGNDFGNFQNATVSGLKFKDADAGRDKDPGEIGLGGWQIHLFGTDGQGNAVHEHTATAADGSYSFTVAPGTYTVCETLAGHPGWVQTFPVSGADCTGHSHAGAPGADGHSVTVTSGATAGDRDFGNTPLSRVNVTFEALADLPGGGDATRATQITCVDTNAANVGSANNSNTLTTDSVKTNQSSLTCTITFVDP